MSMACFTRESSPVHSQRRSFGLDGFGQDFWDIQAPGASLQVPGALGPGTALAKCGCNSYPPTHFAWQYRLLAITPAVVPQAYALRRRVMCSGFAYLLIVTCSQRKRPDPGLLPAIERYDGVHFRVLRKARQEGHWPANLDVLIVSTKYGLLDLDTAIENYDLRMTCTIVMIGKRHS